MYFDFLIHMPPMLGVIASLGVGGSILAYASLAASAAGTALSYKSSQDQAKQAQYNAEAQNEALAAEQQRSATEFAENQRRAAQEHKRQRAQAAAALASSGAVMTTGSPLALLSGMWDAQQAEIGDQGYVQELSQRELLYRRRSALAEGANKARNLRLSGIGTALGNLAETGYQGYKLIPTQSKPTQP